MIAIKIDSQLNACSPVEKLNVVCISGYNNIHIYSIFEDYFLNGPSILIRDRE